MARELCLMLHPGLETTHTFHELLQSYEIWCVPVEPVTLPSGHVLSEWNVLVLSQPKHALSENEMARIRGELSLSGELTQDWISEPVEGFPLAPEIPSRYLQSIQNMYYVESVEIDGVARKVLRTVHYEFQDGDFDDWKIPPLEITL